MNLNSHKNTKKEQAMLEQYHKMCKTNATIALHLDCLDLQ
jgi:hypothetical protein